MNELFTNVFKYALEGRSPGHVTVVFETTDNHAELTVQDNGVGVAESVVTNATPGFGLTIVNMLAEQLGGSFTMDNHTGTKSVVTFTL